MRTQKFFIILLTFTLVILATAQPALAAQEEGVSLPGWVGGLMVVLAIGVPMVLAILLSRKGRL